MQQDARRSGPGQRRRPARCGARENAQPVVISSADSTPVKVAAVAI